VVGFIFEKAADDRRSRRPNRPASLERGKSQAAERRTLSSTFPFFFTILGKGKEERGMKEEGALSLARRREPERSERPREQQVSLRL
jgi:hypothetical protein